MAPEARLEDLLVQLGRARGLKARLGIARDSLDLLRTLSRSDRERVAMKVGSQWAWKTIEPFLMRDGSFDEHDELARKAFEQLGESDPDELRSIARKARRGDFSGLGEAVVRGRRHFLDEGEEDSSEPVPLSEEGAAELRAETEPAPEEPAPEAAPEPAVQESAAPPPRRPVAGPTRVVEKLGAPAPAKPRPVMDWGAPVEARREVVPETLAFDDEGAAPAASARARFQTLRRLHEQPGYALQLGRRGRARLLSRLGPGWPARRALSQMIRSQSYDDLDEALEWVAGLDTNARRAWCLGDLLAHAELDAAEVERVLDAAPTPSTRRRLERRCAR